MSKITWERAKQIIDSLERRTNFTLRAGPGRVTVDVPSGRATGRTIWEALEDLERGNVQVEAFPHERPTPGDYYCNNCSLQEQFWTALPSCPGTR